MIAANIYIPTIDLRLLVESIPYVLTGLSYTLGISLVSFVLGNLLGISLTILSMLPFKPLQWLIRFYISFMRGVPMLVMLFICFYGLPYQLTGIQATIISFTMASSAFLGEIYRGAISGVDQGQWDAAKALGLPFGKTVRMIILPQAFRIAIPSLGNVAMDLLKSTSLAGVITVPEIFQRAKIVGGREFDFMTMYVLVAIIYWLLCIAIGQIQKILEKRAQRYLTHEG